MMKQTYIYLLFLGHNNESDKSVLVDTLKNLVSISSIHDSYDLDTLCI